MRTLLTSLALLFTSLVFTQPSLEFVEPVGGFNSPVDVTGSGDNSGRLFIVERGGRIRVYNQHTGLTQATFFLNIADRVLSGGEQGLLGVAFHPDFATNGRFYVNYTSRGRPGIPEGATVVARFISPVGGPTAPATTEQILLVIPQPAPTHNAGDLAFGSDGYLYIPTGDGGAGDPENNAQNFGSLLGKMLRIDVNNLSSGLNYGIPPDNPFLAENDTIPDEIYAVGLRNPLRISFDRLTGDLWIGDVGQNTREEVNFQAAGTAGGQNYGWDCREGKINYAGSSSSNCANGSIFTPPVFDYAHDADSGGFAVRGGFVYRGSAGDLDGYYVCADYVTNRFFLYEPATETLTAQDQTTVSGATAFGEDDNGELFVVQLSGTLYRVTSFASLPVNLISWTARPRGKTVELSWETSAESGARDYLLERSADGINFSVRSRVAASGNTSETSRYAFTDDVPLSGHSYYRLTQRDLDGALTRYAIRSVTLNTGVGYDMIISPNPSNGSFSLDFPADAKPGQVNLRAFSPDGRCVYNRDQRTEAGVGRLNYRLPFLPAGIYQLLIGQGNNTFTRRLVVR